MVILRYLKHWWETLEFKRRWKRIHQQAASIESIDNVYLSVCESRFRADMIASIARVWQRIPSKARNEFQRHWSRLQLSWDRRKTGILVRIPVIFIGGPFDTVSPFGTMIGLAMVARDQSGFADSGPSLMQLFAGMFLHIRPFVPELPAEYRDVACAQAFAHYFISMENKADRNGYAFTWGVDFDSLTREWGFDVDSYYAWCELTGGSRI